MSDLNRDVNAKLLSARLLYLVKSNEVDAAKDLINTRVDVNIKADVNVKDDYEMASLHLATKECYVKMAEVLLGEDGIDVNIQNADGWTPLHFAAKKNCKEIAEALLEKDGIDVNIKNAKGLTPLHFAAESNCKEVAEALLGKDGIDVNIQNTDGWTPLHFAAESNCKEVAEALLGKDGIDVNIQNTDGLTPLHFAAESNCKEVVEALLGKDGIDVNIQNAKRLTPLHFAENEEIKTLLKKAAEKADESLVHEPSIDNEGGLEEDVGQEGNVQPVIQEQDPEEESQEISAEEGNDVNMQNADGLTPFDLVEDEEIKTLSKRAVEKADESLVHEPSTDNEGGLEEDVGQEGNVQPVIQEQDPEEEPQEISAEERNDVKIEAVKPDNGRSTDTAPTQNDVSLRSESLTSEEQSSSFFGNLFSILMKPFSLIGSFLGGFFSWLFGSDQTTEPEPLSNSGEDELSTKPDQTTMQESPSNSEGEGLKNYQEGDKNSFDII
ncbi:ankyrin repeat domain protein [Wolbachia endosymbiont of Armadillidium vulgare str. wVulC]|uniref:ankyrin repeat domain-containing protein n=1 Tax=Wolbachia endosymbiont of Armadillidium vulgare TaxID=77039 RepID=UPI0006D4C57F|nr:ankyrin repeat domain-containing protein [Wolbachia endosymbiont of Armadillidium vulgare]KLT22423.1 ankyrin repeat domain protein [Wolbachia endosymbiont of Armadillidium vulgare str. wVulC]